jgi:hypothetical protein
VLFDLWPLEKKTKRKSRAILYFYFGMVLQQVVHLEYNIYEEIGWREGEGRDVNSSRRANWMEKD